MNRRRFIQSLVAVFSLSANSTLALRAAATNIPAAATVPAHARSWAVYMSTLHGECTPQTLQSLLNIPALDAKRYVTQLIADGALKPNPLLQRSVSEFVKDGEDSLLNKVKKRLEMKVQSESNETEIVEKIDASECLDAKGTTFEDLPETGLEAVTEDELVEAESQVLDETEVQS